MNSCVNVELLTQSSIAQTEQPKRWSSYMCSTHNLVQENNVAATTKHIVGLLIFQWASYYNGLVIHSPDIAIGVVMNYSGLH